MATNPSISVVICACSHQRLSALVAAVKSVQRQSVVTHELIVVIDHNPQLLSQVAKQISGVTILPNVGSKGLSGARNTGVHAASGEIVAFIDDDAVTDPQWLRALSGAYASQFVIGVGGPILPRWPTARPVWLPEEFDWIVGCSFRGEATSNGCIESLIGCNMSFRRQALLLAGLFDEQLGRNGDNGAGCEESDFASRALLMFPSAHLVHAPDAIVQHVIEPHRTRFAYFLKRCMAEGPSKARMAQDLSRERSFVLSKLGAAFLRNFVETLTFKNDKGWLKSATILVGLAAVAASYGWARVRGVKPTSRSATFRPIHIADIDLVDLREPFSRIFLPGLDENGEPFGAALCVLRQNGRLSGVQEVPLFGKRLSATDLRLALDISVDLDKPPALFAESKSNAAETLSARVVVATRDRPEMLDKCLTSILAQDHPNFEICVVDSASTGPETRQLLATKYAESKTINYMREKRPGLARAHNRGVENCTRDFIAFTDDDVIVDRKWLRTISEAFIAYPGAGAVTGAILPAELDTRAQYWTERHGAFLKGTETQLFDLNENRPTSPLFPYAAGVMGSGANMAFTKATLQAIGPFDAALGAGTAARGGDDLDAFLAVIKAGITLAYVPDAIVWHHHRRSEDGMQRQAVGYGMGLGAYLTKVVLTHPGAAMHFASALPAAVRHMFGSSAPKMHRLPQDYPRRLIWRERLGILAGVPAYFKSRRNQAVKLRHNSSIGAKPMWKGN